MNFFVVCLLLIAGVTAQPQRPYITSSSISSSNQLRPSVYPTSQWGQWGPFGRCTATCGGGKQTRQRACYSVTPNRKVPRPFPSSGSSFDPSMLFLLSSLGNNNGSSSNSLTTLLPLLLGNGGLGGSGGMNNNFLLFSLLPSLTGGNGTSSGSGLSSLLPLLLSSGGTGAGGLSKILPLLLLSGNTNSNSSTGGMDLSTLLLLQMLQQPKRPVVPVVPPMPPMPSCIGSKYDTATCNVVPCMVPTMPPTMKPSPQPQYTRWGEWSNCEMQDNKCVKFRTRTCLSSVCEATKQITYCQSYECKPVVPVNTCNPAGSRVECGYPGISRKECEMKGCCFDSSRKNTMWCFQRMPYMRLKSGVQSSPEQANKPSTNSTEESKSD